MSAKTQHTVTAENLVSYVYDNEPYYTFASSTKESKQLQIRIGAERFRVLHGKEIVYEGEWTLGAVKAYNDITGRPKDKPKTTN